ncbi:hypothetical protein BC936DRAFT_147318 [Jimgerdemannia flammicorona]|uniref:Uncharacterized protein n=2 Tax=Jimgerdemannia flammicorona TaxID=994334 RepID=A0A433QLQ3_9FUNG|nr:hypothetical protein BC936DRAFT_147318 [Jimgerdemannia flammicorona]RUS30723.1 hypothetical protein BC938DRAFT_479036 [Jimgerdemannia flammicorona]
MANECGKFTGHGPPTYAVTCGLIEKCTTDTTLILALKRPPNPPPADEVNITNAIILATFAPHPGPAARPTRTTPHERRARAVFLRTPVRTKAYKSQLLLLQRRLTATRRRPRNREKMAVQELRQPERDGRGGLSRSRSE